MLRHAIRVQTDESTSGQSHRYDRPLGPDLGRSARTGAEGRARGEGAGSHAEARGERRGNVAEKIAAARAMAVDAEGTGGIGSEPVTAGFALRIDALHGETGQVLHLFSLSGHKAQIDSVATA
jgi:hypothetical protein